MSPRLHIVMPCIRPWNLARIAENLFIHQERHPWEIRWHVMLQGPDTDPKGTLKTNEAISMIPDGWVFLWADDTTHHSSLFRRLHEVIVANPSAGAVVFAQNRGDRELHPSPDGMRVGMVCGSMVAYERAFLGDLRMDYAARAHECDGVLVEQLYARDSSRFVFVDEVLIGFNLLPDRC